MTIHLLPTVEDELAGLVNEPNSYKRLLRVMENVELYSYLDLIGGSKILTETGEDGNLVAIHFDMEQTRGHLLSSRIMLEELIILHFYSNSSDQITLQAIKEANQRLEIYWDNKLQ